MPRIHILMRPESSRAVIVWRGSGPKRLVCTVLWDLRTDAFAMGHRYMHAELDARSGDIGPAGDWMTYLVVNHQRAYDRATYIALSRAPFLDPVQLHYGRTGVQIWHSARAKAELGVATVKSEPQLPDDLTLVHEPYNVRLQRDGWTLKRTDVACQSSEAGARRGANKERRADVFHKRFGSVTVQKWDRGDRCYDLLGPSGHLCQTHTILDAQGGEHEHNDWEWSEVHGDRLFWVSGSALYATRRIHPDGRLGEVTQLQDLSDLRHLKQHPKPS